MPFSEPESPSGAGQRLLLHACCGPCATHCVAEVRRLGFEPTLFFANDNLARPTEYGRRREALERVAQRMSVPALFPVWDHSAWLESIAGLESEPEGGQRCSACFRHNLLQTATYARLHGFPAFTSTLTVSPHKRSATVFEAGQAAAEATGSDGNPAFLKLDFKKGGGFLHSIELSRTFGLYRQDHCGCEFSRSSATREAIPAPKPS